MASVPIADFTPAEVKMIVRRGSYTPIVITYTGLDLTGYTDPTFRYGANESVTPEELTVDLDAGADSSFTLTLDAADWAALASVGLVRFELSARTSGGDETSFLTGNLSIEDSFL